MKKIDLKLEFDAIRKRIEEDKNTHKPGVWAELVGVSGSVVSNVHGKSQQKPSLEYIVAVSKATGKSVDYYLWGPQADQEKPEDLKDSQNPLNRFKDSEKGLVLMERLATIESVNPQLFEMAEKQIDAVYNTAVESNEAKLFRSRNGSSG